MNEEKFEKLNVLIQQHIKLKAEINGLTEQQECVDLELKYLMKELKTESFVDTNGNKAVYKEHTRSNFDKTKFKNDYGEEVYNKYVSEQKYAMLKVMTPSDIENVKRFIK